MMLIWTARKNCRVIIHLVLKSMHFVFYDVHLDCSQVLTGDFKIVLYDQDTLSDVRQRFVLILQKEKIMLFFCNRVFVSLC